jgi:preprotein translocase subunit SecE
VQDTAKKARTSKKAGTGKKAKKPGDRPANPFVFVYNYLKQVVAEMRKVIWPNRKQMLTYTSVVLAFLAFMVTLVGLADFGLTKLVLLVFG